MDLADKFREKKEINQVVELIKDHSHTSFWHANLRNHTKANDRNSAAPQNAK